LTDAPPSGYARAVRLILAGLVVLAVGGPAWAGELEQLRDENAKLRARIEALEAENARLRGVEREAPLAAALRESAAAAVQTGVDDDGKQLVTTDPSRLEISAGPGGRHWIVWRTGPEAIELVLESAASGQSYRDVHALELDVDGTAESLPVARHASEHKTPLRGGMPTAGETVVVRVPSATLTRLAAARSAGGALGPLRFRLTPQQLATVRAFSDRVASR
jgi:hypothetical protein